VTRQDILEYDLDSNPIDPGGMESVRERFIHGEIYKARPRREGGRPQSFTLGMVE